MSGIEIVLIVAVGTIAFGPLVFGERRIKVLAAAAAAPVGFTALGYVPGEPRVPGNSDGIPRLTAGADRSDYVSSDTCRSCHPGEYASWHATYHRTMTQLATPQTVIPSFDDVTLESRGRKYHLQRRGDEFWIRMADPDWEQPRQRQGMDLSLIPDPPLVDRRVYMTTGSHHMQGYWIKSQYGNMMRQVPWYFLIPEQRWVPREDAFLQPPDDKRHFMTWNDGCMQCHAVGGSPRMDLESGTGIPDTELAELGISCEACHGPASDHIARHRSPWNRYAAHRSSAADDSIVNPARLSHQRSSEVCGNCHGFMKVRKPREFVVQGSTYRPGDVLELTKQLVQFSPELDGKAQDIFWPDGSCRTGGDEFNGLAASGCYQRGEISCLSCHSMHHSDPNDQLADRREGNEACLQCHTDYRRQLSDHTHHAVDSTGSLCYNCHMPYTSYALLTALRSHQIDSPSVAVSVRSGRPNACNLCHLDQTLEWSARNLTKWYDAPPVELDEDQQTIAASLLWLYRGHAVQRAVVGWHFGWAAAQEASGKEWIAPHLAELLDDPYAAVRFIGERALRTLSGFEQMDYDYLAGSEQQARSKEQVRQLWAADQGVSRNQRWQPVLLESPNRVQIDRIDRLLSTRDLTPVKVAE